MRVRASKSVIVRPEGADEVWKYAKRALQAADAVGRLPTLIEELMAAAEIGSLRIDEEVKQDFSARLVGVAKQTFDSMWQKIRGIADLRERVTYVDENTTTPRIRFAQGHELGHQVLPWHRLDPGRFDDEKSLTLEAEEILDIEANLFSAEVIFQGSNFTRILRDYAVGFGLHLPPCRHARSLSSRNSLALRRRTGRIRCARDILAEQVHSRSFPLG